MEKLTKQEKEFIESRLTKIPSLLIDLTEILKREYFADPYRQRTLILTMLDAAIDLINQCQCLINLENRQDFIYPSDFKSEEV